MIALGGTLLFPLIALVVVWLRNGPFFTMYAFLMLAILLPFCWFFFHGDEFNRQFRMTWQMNFRPNYYAYDKEIAFKIQRIQEEYKCCGWDSIPVSEDSQLLTSCCGQPILRNRPFDNCTKELMPANIMVGCLNTTYFRHFQNLGDILTYGLFMAFAGLFLLSFMLGMTFNFMMRDRSTDIRRLADVRSEQW